MTVLKLASFLVLCLVAAQGSLAGTTPAKDAHTQPLFLTVEHNPSRPLIVVGVNAQGRRIALIFPPGEATPSRVIDIERMEQEARVIEYKVPHGSGKELLKGGKFAQEVTSACRKYGVSARLVESVIHQESGFNPDAVSKAGAAGLMQLMPGTAKDMGVEDRFDPAQNLDGGVRYLAYLLSQFGDVRLALAAYNAGPKAVIKYGGIPPYKETQNYVEAIMSRLGA